MSISTYIFEQRAHRCTLESGVLHLLPFPSPRQDNLPFILKGNVFPNAARITNRPGIEKKMFANVFTTHCV